MAQSPWNHWTLWGFSSFTIEVLEASSDWQNSFKTFITIDDIMWSPPNYLSIASRVKKGIPSSHPPSLPTPQKKKQTYILPAPQTSSSRLKILKGHTYLVYLAPRAHLNGPASAADPVVLAVGGESEAAREPREPSLVIQRPPKVVALRWNFSGRRSTSSVDGWMSAS